jgi:chlorite dismutase
MNETSEPTPEQTVAPAISPVQKRIQEAIHEMQEAQQGALAAGATVVKLSEQGGRMYWTPRPAMEDLRKAFQRLTKAVDVLKALGKELNSSVPATTETAVAPNSNGQESTNKSVNTDGAVTQ